MVGGQAVNLWCLIAGKDDGAVSAELAPFGPFASKDCDVLGDAQLLRELGKRTQLQARVYPPGQPSKCVGFLFEPGDPDREPVVEVLSGICGLPRAEMGDPIQARLDKETVFRVLNPVDLLRAKLANVVEIPQRERQDVRHVRMLVPCVRWYISRVHREAVSGTAADPRLLMRLLRKCIRIVSSRHGRRVGKDHGIDLQGCFPWGLLHESPFESVRNFAEHRNP
jgi:hypothetical protein